MNDVDAVNLGLLIFRVWIGVVMFAHGYRHIFGGGKIQGTAGWFASLGMKPGIVHAWLASLTEIGAGVALITGTLTPLGAAGVIGTMFVAFVTNHFRNGFFIFYKGEGYEYVMTLVCAAFGLTVVGAGEWSVDNALDLSWTQGKGGLFIALAGLAGALALLAGFWRPEKKPAE
ncbi:MAG: DoxX family protein [Acidimicrobiales bacterium]|nr:DoxX family protein [Acidimicrobiales bacterium]